MIHKLNGIKFGVESKTLSSVSVSGVTTTLIDSIYMPANTLSFRYSEVPIVKFIASITITLGTPNFTYYLYWNTGSTITGAIQLGTFTTVASSNGVSFLRHIYPEDDGGTDKVYVIDPTVSLIYDYGDITSGLLTAVTGIDFTIDGYLIYAANKNVSKSTAGYTTGAQFNVNI
jgi:hypothetical protein